MKIIVFLFVTVLMVSNASLAQENMTNGAKLIETILDDNGVEKAKKEFDKMLIDKEAYVIDENEFNALGYKYLFKGQLANALEIFKMNVEFFPASTNVFDSQGEAYLYLGNIDKAVESYSKIKEINSDNNRGERIIKNINNEYLKCQNDKILRFLSAAKSGNIKDLKSWLKINPEMLNKKSKDGNTALYLAVYGNHFEIVEFLIQLGADINTRNIMGQSAYNLADFCKFDEIKNFLLSKNVDTDPQKFPLLESKYLGQEEPGLTPKIFAQGIVSNHRGVYGNIVFTPDFKEACWTPNDGSKIHWNGGIFTSKYINGTWTAPKEILFLDESYSHRSPFYSYDGKRLYFQGYLKENQGFDQIEKFYYVSKTEEGWSEPALLDPIFEKFSIHWQFSLDINDNLYFGGKIRGKENSAGIYFSQKEKGKYKEPELIFESQKLKDFVIGPAVSPNGKYILFIRVHPRGYPSPRIFSMYVSFKNIDGSWSEPTDLGDILKMDANQPRISPDGKYIFFISNGQSFWVSEKIIEELNPKKIK